MTDKETRSLEKKSISPKPEVLPYDSFEKFLVDLKTNMSKCKYRKVLDDLRLRQSMFVMLKDSWKLNELKIRSLNKIITRKIFKYETIPQKAKNIESWLALVDNEIDEWFETIIKDDQEIEKIEILVQVTLEHFYNFAIFAKNQKQIGDCAGFLALGEKIIKVYSDITKDPRTLNICQKILLFISSLLIVDNDFETAKIYQTTTLKLCFKELFIRVDSDQAIHIENMTKVSLYYIQKLFTNIVISFYQRGACEENCGSYLKANEAYCQAKWFTLKFLKNQFPELAQFISDVNERCILYSKVFIKSEVVNFELNSRDKDKDTKNLVIDEEKKIYDDQEQLKIFYSKNIEMISKLKFPEFENNFNKSNENYKEILYTVKTVNNLLSCKFRDIVKNLEKTDIHKIDKDIFNQIQNRLNLIKTEENIRKNSEKEKTKSEKSLPIRWSTTKSERRGDLQSSKKSMKRSLCSVASSNTILLSSNNSQDKKMILSNSNPKLIIQKESSFGPDLLIKNSSHKLSEDINKNNENDLNISKFDEMTIKPLKSENQLTTQNNYKYILPENAINFLTELKENYTGNNHQQQEISKSLSKTSGTIKRRLDEIEKFNYDGYISNKNFQKKLEKLNNVSTKELNFQRKILNLKRLEKDVIPNIDVNNIENKHKNSLVMRMKNSLKILNYLDEKNVKKNSNEILTKNKKQKEIQKLEVKIVKSLDTKQLNQLNKIKLQQKIKNNVKLRDEFKPVTNEDNCDMNKIINENHLIIDKIDRELELIERIRFDNMKEMHPFQYRERVYTARKAISPCLKPNKSMDQFVKILKNTNGKKSNATSN